MKRNRRRLPVPQHEFGFTPATFNLAIETGFFLVLRAPDPAKAPALWTRFLVSGDVPYRFLDFAPEFADRERRSQEQDGAWLTIVTGQREAEHRRRHVGHLAVNGL